MSSALGLESC